MFKEIITSRKYWLSVFFLGVGLVFLYSVFEHFMEYKGIDVDSFMKDKINEGNWIRYGISRLVGVLLYGMITAYHFETKKRK